MSEYKTLKEWFGDATRGDGRKFGLECTVVWSFFEPIFKDADGYWHGVNHNGYACCEKATLLAKEWHPPKQKKKMWLWAYYNNSLHEWQQSTSYYATEEKAVYIVGHDVVMKLEHTMIEVDE